MIEKHFMGHSITFWMEGVLMPSISSFGLIGNDKSDNSILLLIAIR